MKLSKFNFYTKNKNNELLLFNTLQGTQSFLKIPAQKADSVSDYLSGNNATQSIDENILDELQKNGYVIADSINEDAKLRSVYLKSIADSELLLTIIPTEKCNFRCKYCYESFPERDMNKEMQRAVILYLQKNIRKYTSLHIAWFGGEPLLAIDIIEEMSEEIKNLCRFYKIPFTASITTNGYLLDTENFKRLLRCNVLYYQITIDGTKQIHDCQRPHETDKGSTYDVIIENLKAIRDNVYERLFRITIRSNFSKLHSNRIAEYKESFFNWFGDDKRFQFLIRPVMDWGGNAVDNFRDQLIDKTGVKQIYNEVMSAKNKLPYIYEDFLNNAGSVCEAGKKNSYIITPNGNIYKCTCNFDDCPEAKIGQLDACGNMRIDENAADQWLCSFSNCNLDCIYAPICLREACSANRVLHGNRNIKCPIEKNNLVETLLLLDSQNEAFKKVE